MVVVPNCRNITEVWSEMSFTVLRVHHKARWNRTAVGFMALWVKINCQSHNQLSESKDRHQLKCFHNVFLIITLETNKVLRILFHRFQKIWLNLSICGKQLVNHWQDALQMLFFIDLEIRLSTLLSGFTNMPQMYRMNFRYVLCVTVFLQFKIFWSKYNIQRWGKLPKSRSYQSSLPVTAFF